MSSTFLTSRDDKSESDSTGDQSQPPASNHVLVIQCVLAVVFGALASTTARKDSP